ncbi:MAG: hypothetical protein HGB12_13545 [Bacteroidetes bacterium]|nr:hypothetical protein [Bacteroidota bacterium]
MKEKYYTGWTKALHFVFIWLIPFIWILLLKSLLKPLPGSGSFDNKKDTDGFKDNIDPTDLAGLNGQTPNAN